MLTTKLHINLHRQKHGLPGIVAITQHGLIVGYCDSATLVRCGVWQNDKLAAFSRTPGNKRTVHIAVTGTLIDVQGFVSLKSRQVIVSPLSSLACPVVQPTRKATYNPKRADQGFMVDGEIWNGGESCTVTNEDMYVS